MSRSVGAKVILVNGLMACYISRGEKQLSLFLPEDEPLRSIVAREVARQLASLVRDGTRRALLIARDQRRAGLALAAGAVPRRGRIRGDGDGLSTEATTEMTTLTMTMEETIRSRFDEFTRAWNAHDVPADGGLLRRGRQHHPSAGRVCRRPCKASPRC